jgi:replicative DNA helicase
MKPDILESENYLISCAMQDREHYFTSASEGVTPALFTDGNNRALWIALGDAATSAPDTAPESLALVHPELDRTKLYFRFAQASTSIYLATHIQRVTAAHKMRLVESALTKAHEAATDHSEDFGEYWAKISAHVEQAYAISVNSTRRNLAQMVAEFKEQITNPNSTTTVSTGWPAVDRIFGPPRCGELITVAARTGCGKSAVALQIALSIAMKGMRTAVFSAEMGSSEVLGRWVAIQMAKPVKSNLNAACDEADKLAKLKDKIMLYDDTEIHSISAIEARCRALATLQGGLSAVVVDYIGLVTPDDTRAPREQQIAGMTRRLKRLAATLKCPVFMLCQLNREIEKNGKPRPPLLSDLRESGSIEQDSNGVWFIADDQQFLDAHPAGELPDTIVVQLIQAKRRNGKPGVAIRMAFDRPCNRLFPVAN